MRTAIRMDPKDLYHPGELREHKTVLPSEFAQIPRPAQTGMISGFFITGSLGAHCGSYPFAVCSCPLPRSRSSTRATPQTRCSPTD